MQKGVVVQEGCHSQSYNTVSAPLVSTSAAPADLTYLTSTFKSCLYSFISPSQETCYYIKWVLPIPVFCMICAGLCNSIMDTLAYHFNASIFAEMEDHMYWNPNLSWTLKWKDGNPDNGPAFFGSTTFLVWSTDAWHLFKALFLMFIMLSVISTAHMYVHFTRIDFTSQTQTQTQTHMFPLWKYSICTYIILHLSMSCTFELFYSFVWVLG